MIARGLSGPDYDAVRIGLTRGGSIYRMASCPLSELATVRRKLRTELMRDAGLLRAEDRPAIYVYVGQAEIRNVWARLIETPIFAVGTEHRSQLDVLVFHWAPAIDDADDRAVLLCGFLLVTAKPPEVDAGGPGYWTFGYPDGHEDRVDPRTGERPT